MAVLDIKSFIDGKDINKKYKLKIGKDPEETKDKEIPKGQVQIELINTEKMDINKRPVTQKVDALRGTFDEDFMSMDHKFNLDLISHQIKNKTNINIDTRIVQILFIAICTFMLFFGICSGLVETLLTMVYPAFMSLQALESRSPKDDRVWLN